MTVKATKARAKAVARIVWRDGVHIAGTPIWCDARHAREACFVSHANVSEVGRHRQVIATDVTAKLFPAAIRKHQRTALAVPYGRPFSLGTSRLELFPSGHLPGAASLLVEMKDGLRVAYAGSVNPVGEGISGRAELRACDVLVVNATFGQARFRFPSSSESKAHILAWVAETLREGATPVLLSQALGVGTELVSLLAGTHTLRAHRVLLEHESRLRELGFERPPLRRLVRKPVAGEVVLWPIEGREARAITAIRQARIALVSGFALDAMVVRRLRVDASFPFAQEADHDALVSYIVATGASEVYLLGGGRDALARELGARRLVTHTLGPPQQLSLF